MQDNIDNRGNFTTCQACNFKFRFNNVEDRDKWTNTNYKCPSCAELFCNKPKMERELFILQEAYLKSKHKKDFDNLIKLLIKYCEGLTKKFYSNRVLMLTESLEHYALVAVTFVVEDYYLKHNDRKVDASFAGVLKGKIRQAIFSKNEMPSNASSLNWEFDDGKETMYACDSKYCVVDNIETQQTKIELHNYVVNIIKEIKSQCSPIEDYMRILAIRHYFIDGESKTDRLFQEEFKNKNNEVIIHKTYGRIGKYKYLKTLDIIRKELMKIT